MVDYFSTVFVVSDELSMRIFLLFAVLLMVHSPCWARPEYAVRYNINRCTTCHTSPAGGGPRTVMGKNIGAFGYRPNQWNQFDKAGADIKMIYLRPRDARNARGGMGVMNGSAWINLKLNEDENPEAKEFRIVAEQNIGGFNAGPRSWYARWQLSPSDATSWLPQYILVGRFLPAFGIMTDEHQTYVRLQTGTPWNTGIDTGFLLSANPSQEIHYDLAIMNGRKSSGQGISQALADQWGSIFNLRWLLPKWPVMIGISASQYPATALSAVAHAQTVYSVISLARWTDNRLPLSLSFEFARAKNWNPSFTPAFVSENAFAEIVASANSEGRYFLADYEVKPYLSAQYKYDELILNRTYPADAYRRHGIGFKYRLENNAWILLRLEKALPGQPAEKKGTKYGAQDMAWAVLSVSI